MPASRSAAYELCPSGCILNWLGTQVPSFLTDNSAGIHSPVNFCRGRPRGHSSSCAGHDPRRENSYWSFSRRIAGYDPIAYWKQVNVPVLLLYGEADQRVPPEASAKRITAALHEEGNNEVTVRFFPSADHTLRLPGSGKGFSWPRNPPGYPGELTRWLQSRVIN